MSLPSSQNSVPPDFFSFLSSGTIEIVAESGQRRFLVHSDILAKQSELLYKELKESSPKQVDLSDWEGDIVGRFAEFIYIGNYQFPELDFKEDIVESEDEDGVRAGANTPDTIQSFADRGKSRINGADVLLLHAKLYTLAQYKEVEVLRVMAFKRLREALEVIDGPIVAGTPRAVVGVINLLGYVYSHTESHKIPKNQIRDLVSTFAAKNFETLADWDQMRVLLSAGGDLPVELMGKVARRLYRTGRPCDCGELCGAGGTICDMKSEIQSWKSRAATLGESIGRLEAANEKKVLQLEVANREMWTLETKVKKYEADWQWLKTTYPAKAKEREVMMSRSAPRSNDPQPVPLPNPLPLPNYIPWGYRI